MQLGTRWPVGEKPPASLPAAVVAAVAGVEAELRGVGQDVSTWRWTLTWLERRPILDLDDGTRIRYLPAEDSAVITSVELDEAAAEDGAVG